MIEEAAMGEGCSVWRAKQLAKEPLEVFVGSSFSTPSVAGHHLSTAKGLQTPISFRSEVDQQIGHELMEALSNLKQLMVAPSSTSTHST